MEKDNLTGNFNVVVIGGSAGSLEVIIRILGELRNNRIAIVLIIHRKASVNSSLAEFLKLKASVGVKEAEEKEYISPGNVYIAPADYHLLIESDGSVTLDYSEKINFSRPSIDVTFQCAADAYANRVTGILLSGGNSDGVYGLKVIKNAGGVCIVQDPETALVSYMPQQALIEKLPDKILTATEIADFLNNIP
ncbi:MAG TPA: chemotaxis protein CheB [Flavitalea sp.]|nr:chemotaxis protein CheB [Flavitalea sp.]